MNSKPFNPVTFEVAVIKPEYAAASHSGYSNIFDVVAQLIVEPGGTFGSDRVTVEKNAYAIAVANLNRLYPGQWEYAYGDLDKGDYSGQFHWNDSIGWRQYVPAYVICHDPEAIARAEKEAEERADAAKVKETEIAQLPAMTFAPDKEPLWQSWVDANQDSYGGAVVAYARQWAQLMERDIKALPATYVGKDIEAIFERTSHEADTQGITGFMYGAAVSMLADAWVYGKALNRWHNAQYGQPDAEGTVNPALLTIEIKD